MSAPVPAPSPEPATAPAAPTVAEAMAAGGFEQTVARREQLRSLAAGRTVSGGVPYPDVDVDAVISRQLTQDDMKRMTHGEISRAHEEGRLLVLHQMPGTLPVVNHTTPRTAPTAPSPIEGQLTREQLKAMTAAGQHKEVLAARADGRLDDLMGPR